MTPDTEVGGAVTGPRHIFISFSSTDAQTAHRVVASLERSGLRCWFSDRDIEPAASYPAAITDAVKSSGAVLLLLTDASNQSPHVTREIELAFNGRRPILPLRIGGATPSPDLQYFLSRSQWLDAGTALDDEELTRVETRVRELLRGRPGPVGVDWRRWLQPALLVAVLAAGTAGVFVWNGRNPPNSSVTPVPEEKAVPEEKLAPEGKPATPADKPAVALNTAKVNPKDGQSYAWIPPGRFIMGCSAGDSACEKDEGPPHSVEIRHGFWLARTEVVEQQFRERAGGRTSGADTSVKGLPATRVSWAAAKSYCQAIGGRLPTEAEWEYAARAGTSTRYYGSLPPIAWFSDNSDDKPHAVGAKTANAFGLHDMLGNVSEWVVDRYYNAYDDTSDAEAVEQPLVGNASGVARGGSWLSDADGVRVSRRLEMYPDAEEPHIGFRCAVDRL